MHSAIGDSSGGETESQPEVNRIPRGIRGADLPLTLATVATFCSKKIAIPSQPRTLNALRTGKRVAAGEASVAGGRGGSSESDECVDASCDLGLLV